MKRALLSFVVLAFVSGPAAAETMSAGDVRATVGSFLDATRNYQARFEQLVTDERGLLVEEGAGTFWLKRPGNLRWHYEQPWERDIAATESRIWMYDAELEQLTIRAASGALATTPAALLIGDISVLDDYALAGQLAADADGAAQSEVTLTPLGSGGDFARIGLIFNNALLTELVLFDRFGQRTQIKFTDIRVNEPIDAVVFEIDVPDTADVIDESEF
jgi:outer membrane lipoprotein carrier protein